MRPETLEDEAGDAEGPQAPVNEVAGGEAGVETGTVENATEEPAGDEAQVNQVTGAEAEGGDAVRGEPENDDVGEGLQGARNGEADIIAADEEIDALVCGLRETVGVPGTEAEELPPIGSLLDHLDVTIDLNDEGVVQAEAGGSSPPIRSRHDVTSRKSPSHPRTPRSHFSGASSDLPSISPLPDVDGILDRVEERPESPILTGECKKRKKALARGGKGKKNMQAVHVA